MWCCGIDKAGLKSADDDDGWSKWRTIRIQYSRRMTPAAVCLFIGPRRSGEGLGWGSMCDLYGLQGDINGVGLCGMGFWLRFWLCFTRTVLLIVVVLPRHHQG